MFQLNLFKQMISMNKLAFDSAYSALSMVQDQTEQMTSFYLQQHAKLPEHNKKIFTDWVGVLKKGRDEYKKVMDQVYDSLTK